MVLQCHQLALDAHCHATRRPRSPVVAGLGHVYRAILDAAVDAARAVRPGSHVGHGRPVGRNHAVSGGVFGDGHLWHLERRSVPVRVPGALGAGAGQATQLFPVLFFVSARANSRLEHSLLLPQCRVVVADAARVDSYGFWGRHGIGARVHDVVSLGLGPAGRSFVPRLFAAGAVVRRANDVDAAVGDLRGHVCFVAGRVEGK
mmetsp:Transcript_13205/g.29003  ORF Transcript_13205/g.29003 Transcript_13205/m.29003 type:complete len:203 (-) Transcript_13205:394-1002(-)